MRQESRHYLPGSSASGSPTRLQSRYWPWLGSHRKDHMRKDLLLSSCGCWQNSVPQVLLDWGPQVPSWLLARDYPQCLVSSWLGTAPTESSLLDQSLQDEKALDNLLVRWKSQSSITYSWRRYSVPFATFCWLEASHQASPIWGDGIIQVCEFRK